MLQKEIVARAADTTSHITQIIQTCTRLSTVTMNLQKVGESHINKQEDTHVDEKGLIYVVPVTDSVNVMLSVVLDNVLQIVTHFCC